MSFRRLENRRSERCFAYHCAVSKFWTVPYLSIVNEFRTVPYFVHLFRCPKTNRLAVKLTHFSKWSHHIVHRVFYYGKGGPVVEDTMTLYLPPSIRWVLSQKYIGLGIDKRAERHDTIYCFNYNELFLLFIIIFWHFIHDSTVLRMPCGCCILSLVVAYACLPPIKEKHFVFFPYSAAAKLKLPPSLRMATFRRILKIKVYWLWTLLN